MTKSPPPGRKFPCPACGAKLDFDPGQRALKCPYCQHVEEIAVGPGAVEERDYEAYLHHHAGVEKTIEGRSQEVRCPGCGAVVLIEDKVVTDVCPYCATHMENAPESAAAMIPPESLLPFKVETRAARKAFDEWVASRWFAPSSLKKLADLGRFSGIYVPFWTYDSMTYTPYSGQRGDDYTTTETYTVTDSDGNQRTESRTVVHTAWTWVSGEVQHFFDDVLICGSKSMPGDMVSELVPWDMHELEPFQPSFLSGFKTERYAVNLEQGFEMAKAEMDAAIVGLIRRDIGGDHQQIDSYQTRHLGITFKHVLLPVWLASYRYHDQLYQILVNARTGEVVGRRPYSTWKIASTVIAAMLLVASIVAVAMRH